MAIPLTRTTTQQGALGFFSNSEIPAAQGLAAIFDRTKRLTMTRVKQQHVARSV
ncbi:MAG: hypothetical protein KZQ86_03365 [Candidatus Thiodiazotropha sp. (ex Lucinoma kastoroae)]|nr:hypothetical protein [Candidatus Thiodiazotropha sp. (ex Lucinoma kastoroae)]